MDFKKDIDRECAFHIANNSKFCSPPEIVDKLKKIAATNDEDKAKEILGSKTGCDTETCILSNNLVKNEVGPSVIDGVLIEYFKPTGPANTKAWLSNVDIDSVLDQIQKKYVDKKFKHIKYQMIDFEKNETDLATLNWPAEYDAGFRTFGTVVNTDLSTGSGIHWFAIFGCFEDSAKEFTIEYFNSAGGLPMKEIWVWMKRVKNEWSSHFNKPIKDIVSSRMVNQFDSSSCGSYSLYYIISRLDGTPYEWFADNKIGDKNMQIFRQYLFRDK